MSDRALLVPRLINSVVDFGNLGYSCTGI